MDGISLIDVSSEDDVLVPITVAADKPVYSGLVAENVNSIAARNEMEHAPEHSESPERKQAKTGKINMRKSLAWDKAFFNSEGVLNAEELGIVNNTFRRTESSFPTTTSTSSSVESAATFKSETWALDNLEVRLFKNLQGSIQRSYVHHNESSTMLQSSKTAEQMVPNATSTRNKSGKLGLIAGRVTSMAARNEMEHAPELSESPERKQAKAGKINLRKSLAWDKSFFNSEGVLNAEELSIVNSTFGKTGSSSLTTISEITRSSVESAATINSENSALDNLEVDLFENFRESIQRPCMHHTEASIMVQSTKNVEQTVQNATNARTSSKVNRPQNKIKSPSVLKRSSINKQQQLDKELPTNATVAANRQGDSKSLLKPPRCASKIASLPLVPRKRDPNYGNIGVKNNAAMTPAGRVAKKQSVLSPKELCINNGSVIPSSAVLQNPSSLSQGGSIPYQNFTCGSFHSGSLPSREAARKKVDSRSFKCSLRGSVSKAPPKTVKVQPASTNSCNSPPSRNFVAWSSSASPASSIDSVTSGSSSISGGYKSSVFFEASNVGLATSSSTTPPFPLPELQKCLRLQPSVRKDCHALPRSHAIEISPRNQSSTVDASGISKKPSGLRMPTPHIGYFDAKTIKSPHLGGDSSLRRVSGNSNDAGACRITASKSEPAKSPMHTPLATCDSPHTCSGNGPIDHLNKGGSLSSRAPINQLNNVSVSVVAKDNNPADNAFQLGKEDHKGLEKENLAPGDQSGSSDRHMNMYACSPAIEDIEEKISSLRLH